MPAVPQFELIFDTDSSIDGALERPPPPQLCIGVKAARVLALFDKAFEE